MQLLLTGFKFHVDFLFFIIAHFLIITGDVSFPDAAPDTITDFLNQFEALAPGSRLYTVKAKQNPQDPGYVLGDVVTSDECVSSKFGDTKMFFKHQWIEEDIALRPEWSDAYYEDCFCNIP